MHYFLYPTKDAFITDHPLYILKNTGLDEILEVEKSLEQDVANSISGSIGTVLSRAVLQFDFSEISGAISIGNVITPRFFLNMKVADSTEIPVNYTLAAYPLAVSWSMGTGYKYDGATVPDGINWKYTNGSGSDAWWQYTKEYEGGGTWFVSQSLVGSGSGYAEPPFVSPDPYDPFPFCTASVDDTGSAVTHSIEPVTGGFACYQHFDYQTADVHMDITTIVNAWLSGTIPNNGLILLHSGESNAVNYGKLRFFSKETNTVYSPCIDISWDDHIFVTGSSDPIQINNAVVTVKNLSTAYKFGSIARMDLTARSRYTIRTFTNNYYPTGSTQYLPYDSFYSIKDANSSNVVIDYDEATRLSYTPELGNYFFLDTSGLAQERFYKISIKSEQNGSVVTFENPTPFKIVR